MPKAKVAMSFSGKNLTLVRSAIDDAIKEIHNMIGTCPDVITYWSDIEGYEREKAAYERLAARIDRRMGEKT